MDSWEPDNNGLWPVSLNVHLQNILIKYQAYVNKPLKVRDKENL
jgi:hypothetical protein